MSVAPLGVLLQPLLTKMQAEVWQPPPTEHCGQSTAALSLSSLAGSQDINTLLSTSILELVPSHRITRTRWYPSSRSLARVITCIREHGVYRRSRYRPTFPSTLVTTLPSRLLRRLSTVPLCTTYVLTYNASLFNANDNSASISHSPIPPTLLLSTPPTALIHPAALKVVQWASITSTLQPARAQAPWTCLSAR